jgi:hypothetical protein
MDAASTSARAFRLYVGLVLLLLLLELAAFAVWKQGTARANRRHAITVERVERDLEGFRPEVDCARPVGLYAGIDDFYQDRLSFSQLANYALAPCRVDFFGRLPPRPGEQSLVHESHPLFGASRGPRHGQFRLLEDP